MFLCRKRRKFNLASNIKFKASSPKIDLNMEITPKLNVFQYHNYILHKLEDNIKENSVREQQIDELDERLNIEQFYLNDRRQLEDKINKLKKEISETYIRKENYLKQVQNILDEHKKIHKSFTLTLETNTQRSAQLLKNINDFQRVAQKYCPEINLYMPDTPDTHCQYCLEPVFIEEEVVICKHCGADYINNMCVNNSSGTPKNTYESIINFNKALDIYQGIVTPPPDSVIDKIKTYCEEKNLNTEDLYALDIREILKKLKLVAWYKATYLILHLVTGKPLADLSEVKDQLIKDFQILNNLYRENKGPNRKSTINIWKILEVLLVKNDIPTHTKNFKKPTTGDINIQNNQILCKLFKLAGWKYEGIF